MCDHGWSGQLTSRASTSRWGRSPRHSLRVLARGGGSPRLYPDQPGFADGIQAAIRWSHYVLAGGGGVAILDRGLPGRELTGNTPVPFLLNAQDTYMGYPGGWLSGKGTQRASFALVAHDGLWNDARVPHRAWEFNAPPVVVENVAKTVRAWAAGGFR